MKCIDHDRCGNDVDFGHPMTYWEATVAVRDRDGGGPNRRSLKRTGRGWCVQCSTWHDGHPWAFGFTECRRCGERRR